MATKSKVHVLDVSSEDPASTHGATSVCLDLMRYVPTISEDGEKRKRMMVGGDQGVCERFRKAILGRAEEKKLNFRGAPLLVSIKSTTPSA